MRVNEYVLDTLSSKSAIFVLTFVLTITGFAFAQAQPTRIGILGPDEEPRFSELVRGLKQGLNDHGYSATSMEILETRVTRGDQPGARSAVEGLMRRQVKMLFVIGSELAKLARQVSREIQIVFLTPGDPVTAGVVSSLAHPGGNMTAMTFEFPELSGKRLELLKETVPGRQRVVIIYDPRDASPMQGVAAARSAAPSLSLRLHEQAVRNREELIRALASLNRGEVLLGIPGGFPSSHFAEIIRAANTKKIATMYHSHSATTLDALASYGADDTNIARQAARLVDKILKGTKAGDIPVERPLKLEFVINLKTAKQIGLTIPPNVLVRADRVIR